MIGQVLRYRGFPLLFALAFLAGCGTSGGDRKKAEFADAVAILAPEEQIEADPELAAEPLVLPPVLANADWPQASGDADHVLGHVAAPESPRRAWRKRVVSRKAVGAPITSPPVVAGERLYTIDAAGLVQAFAADDGTRIWQRDLQPDVRDPKARRFNIFARTNPANIGFGGGVAFADGRLFVTSGFGFVAALDAATGELLWQYDAPSPMRNPPTTAEGRVIAVSISNEVIALDQETGEEVWTYESFEEPARFLGAAAPAVWGESVAVPLSSGELVALEHANGRILWQQMISRTSRLNALSALGDIAGSPLLDRGAAFTVSQSGQMAGIDLRTGSVAWEQPVGGYHTPWLAGETLYVVSNSGRLVAVNRIDGRIRFSVELPAYRNPRRRKNRIAWAGPVLGGGRLWLAGSGGEMIGVSPETGEILERVKLKGGSNLPPVIAGNTIYVMTEDGHVEAFR